MTTLHKRVYQYRFILLLRMAPFQRRPRGWRFGTKTISNQVIARLVASGRARIDGDRCELVTEALAP